MNKHRIVTPQEKYTNDPQYRRFVNHLEYMIHQAQFTPSDIREMSTLACIRYEMNRTSRYISSPELDTAFKAFENFMENKS